MIGISLPVHSRFWRICAHSGACGVRALGARGSWCLSGFADGDPQNTPTSVYHFRTPSPRGQHRINHFVLPTFFGFKSTFWRLSAQTLARRQRLLRYAANLSSLRSRMQRQDKDVSTCARRGSLWDLSHSQVWLHVVTQWASKLWSAGRSAQALPPFSTEAWLQARRSARLAIWPIASNTHLAANAARIDIRQPSAGPNTWRAAVRGPSRAAVLR